MIVNYLNSENSWSAHSLVDSLASGILEDVIHRTLVVEGKKEKLIDAKYSATIYLSLIQLLRYSLNFNLKKQDQENFFHKI